ncbi:MULTISPECIES: GntR family transcriptional regulator [Pseudomonas]|jgi:GntR family transcriptional regulator of vanillate catabolism|uniref:GntR family transcriptional regulator n=1 Tax=Pseudomonas vlassakiae TaxID=485888 RepID=A0A923K6T6_9PSED|nr:MULTISPECIES: GntR family transcriptional regulator [Pseudomonas]AXQ48537.1 GntR family transcriptional regulator [Stenotrophomonas rhizophila]MBH3410833.1 GntR family transcriptional regulator [Pseudomonas putida]MBS3185680.1 GntR family transcriptional regulator [Pseudomonas sp. PCH44]MBV4543171.1 GntR family transcriptional regulator [Pseudomonas vlassakiae]PIK80363.1 GntR family transcriptional regulator [Pseudomonas sp. 382]
MSKHGQTILVALRKMIASGELAGGERLMEVPTAERFGVSRMPVRMAFRTLEQEGLLVRHGGKGFQVRTLSVDDLTGAVEVRGVLEGLAARLCAERGLDAQAMATLVQCLDEGDALFAKGYITEQDLAAYHDLNVRLHQVIVAGSGNPAIAEALARNDHRPFASVSALAFDRDDMAREYRRFNYAHMQHHSLVDALRNGQGARAENIMREHANATLRYAEVFGAASTASGVQVISRGD